MQASIKYFCALLLRRSCCQTGLRKLLFPEIKISAKSPVFAVCFFSLQPPVSVLSLVSGYLLRKQLQQNCRTVTVTVFKDRFPSVLPFYQ